ncbi:MAG: hypothetical protein M1442_04210 [Candidatus Thermoplasmatota archaeon]|nr:hypothetical protein [Candidatus Thermoplasmatota archaeon]
MSCLLCGDETFGGDAICTSCAYSNLGDGWYTAEEDEGYFRLQSIGLLAAVLADGDIVLTEGVEPFDSFISSLPDTEDGYRAAIAVMTGILDHMRLGEKEHFALPAFGHVSKLLERLERYEDTFPHLADDSFYRRMSTLYTAAARLFYLPLAPEGFSESRKRALVEKASYWEGRLSGGASGLAQIPHVEKEESAGGEKPAAGAAGPAAENLLPMVEALKSRIRNMESAISQIQERTHYLKAAAPSGPAQAEEQNAGTETEDSASAEEGVLLLKRAKVDMLSGRYQEALSGYLLKIGGFPSDGDDLVGAVTAALRLKDWEKAHEAVELCLRRGITENADLARSVFAWHEGKWGMALQLADGEIVNAKSSAAFIFKLNICAQYGLADRERELREQQKLVGDIQSGANLISGFYLSLGMWGAAMQCINVTPADEWTDGTFSVLGMALEEKGDIAGALRAYDDALRINGHNSTALIRKGMMMSRSGDHSDALRLFREETFLWPATAWLVSAELRSLNRGAEALELIRTAVGEDAANLRLAKTGLALAAELGKAKERRYFAQLIREAGKG